jgi:hypothetical protein
MSASYPTCQHLHPTGRRCGSPALRGEQFCFFHHPTRRPPSHASTAHLPFNLPALFDAEDVQNSLSEIARRVADNTLDPKRAGLLLMALRMAKTNLAAMSSSGLS